MKQFHQYLDAPWKKFLFWAVIVLILCIILFTIGGIVGYGISSDNSPFQFLNGKTWDHVFSFIR
ncbi:DNA-directed RNA polymerase subunit beta [Aerococcus agrisoli]|uniref:DNA-directed RNA polymerase subunit beta n=1 Tax=Aerococcus agrisoli TaxID=2487350 RepID=A0A3N4GMM3_9LACT|nr:DNA-directed RNA polymerase subunit beta [Aerococcus agrisoli]RPA59830.1 DNA-directed RNA polymerase subunit beta [Aerococcus agrisoli]